MKKVISIILSAALVLSLCTVCVSAANENTADLSYAVAADLHYTQPEEALTWYSEDPIFGYANRRAAMENESQFIIDEFLNQCAEDDNIKFILVPGDLTNDGKMFLEDHKVVAEKFRKFEKKTGKQIYVINGNHDVGIPGEYCTTGMSEFIDTYYEFGYKEALVRTDYDCSYTADLSEKYRLIALDSCDHDKSTEDGMTEEKVQWVIDQAEQAKADGKHPILMMHHNLLDHLPMQRILSRNFIIRNHTLTAENWANAGIKLVFSGHEHCSDATTFISALGNKISDFATTSLSMYPLQYRYVEMREDTISYEAKTIEKIDTNALSRTVDGYSNAQLSEMNKGLNDFAKHFLKNGVEWRLERGFQDEQLGIKEGDFYYDLVRDAVDGLNDILNMPLYGEGSAQELGRTHGIEIPDSDYKDGWDVATELVAAHYAGSENYPLSGRDVQILLKTVSIVLHTELDMISEREFTQATASLLSVMGMGSAIDLAAKIYGDASGISAGEYFLVALLSPLLQSFANDDGVDDNNGTIEGYGSNDAMANIGDNLGNFFSKFFDNVVRMFKIFLKMFGYNLPL